MENGYTINPRRIGRQEIDFLRCHRYVTSPEYASTQIKRLVMFCRWAGNQNLARLKIGYATSPTSKARWLMDEEAMALRDCAVSPVEKFIIHCELDLGMRKIEVRRLTLESFRTGRVNTVTIHGKGRNGGKYRTINWHPDTPKVLNDILVYRQQLIERVVQQHKVAVVPDEILLCHYGKELRPYGETQIDNILSEVGKRAEVKVSNHDLRRTCGRMMYRSTVPIEVIARIFGHSDTRTTMRYLGLDFEDMSSAFEAYSRYQKAVVPKMVQNAKSQSKCGGTGI